jgi:enamine deaminase RidA (YjgF/YER057c/UK114 family)
MTRSALFPFAAPSDSKAAATPVFLKGYSMSEIKRIGVGARMSEAVCYNGIAWLAGQVGTAGESVTQQTQTCLAEVDRILAAAGTDKTRILSTQIWLADMADFAEMNAVWDTWVPQGHTPARATGEAKLAAPGYLVEVIVTAALA